MEFHLSGFGGFKRRRIPRDLILDPPPQRRRWWLWVLLSLAVTGCALATLSAIASPVPQDKERESHAPSHARTGQLYFKEGSFGFVESVHLDTTVDIRVTGIIAKTTMVQHFENQTDDWREAIYVFPLPETAAIFDMQLRIADRVIRSVVKERQEARAIYNEAKAQGKKAALTEQSRPNLFTQAVANIAPHEQIEVKLEFIDRVAYDNGEFSLRMPLTITPRYIPGSVLPDESLDFKVDTFGWGNATDQVPDAPSITPPMLPASTASTIVNPVTISVHIDAGLSLRDIASAYHDIRTARHGTKYEIVLTDGRTSMDRDFLLSWSPSKGSAPRAAVFTDHVARKDYALVMLVPPSSASDAERLPRDMVFVVDTSGSMDGTSIVQARQGLTEAISKLRPIDRFNIIRFASNFSFAFPTQVPADPFYLGQAHNWVSTLSASGGTEMAAPLSAALRLPSTEGYLKHIIFITDGAVGNETALFELIDQHLGTARLFTVGIGSAPNSYFMRKSAQFGGGTFTHIGDIKEVATRMEELLRKIESPITTSLSIESPASTRMEIFPRQLPTLYQSEPLVILVQGDELRGDIVIDGQGADGPWTSKLPLTINENQSGIATLWARAKIESLEDEKIAGRNAAEVRAEVIAVALAHGLVSSYTSRVAVEEVISRLPSDPLRSGAIPNAVAAGQTVPPVMLPRTATPATLYGYLGAMLLVLAMGFYVRGRTARTVC